MFMACVGVTCKNEKVMSQKQESQMPMAEMHLSGEASVEDFVNTGRTGRRNALPDVLDPQHAAVGTGNLALDLQKLQCSPAARILHDCLSPDDNEANKSSIACTDHQSQNKTNSETEGKT